MAPITRRSEMVREPTTPQKTLKNVLVELRVRSKKGCMLCGSKKVNEKLYGILYQINDIIAHYFCILLASKSVQNGADNEGIFGFLYEDIKSEINRGSKKSCVYCKKKGATISCCGTKCKKNFHLPCGLKNKSMHQYFQSFKSYCQQHHIKQIVNKTELQNTAALHCGICKNKVKPSPSFSTIWASCCKHNTWFHRKCVQEMALNAGYYFKCPLCNNVKQFKCTMLTLGIYIPSRDASWETVPNAYEELTERHNTCNAPICQCPHEGKRKFKHSSGSWELLLCNTCGSKGIHRGCSSIDCDQEWCCTVCKKVIDT